MTAPPSGIPERLSRGREKLGAFVERIDGVQLLGEHALALAAHGLAVFPVHGVVDGRCMCGRRACDSSGKHPRTKHGHRDATTSRDQIQMWWNACKNANIGVRTGDGLLVLDVDPRNGGNESLRLLLTQHGPLPATPAVSTGGGGQHFYFAIEGNVACKSGLWPGIDVKADGGYVIAPPSHHATGASYGWEKGRSLQDLSIEPAPAWLLAAMEAGDKRASKRDSTGAVQAGGRNDHLMSVAGRLRRDGADEKRIRDALRRENDASCRPALDAVEVERIAASASRYPVGSGGGSVAEILRAAGVATLTSQSPISEREEGVKQLRLGANDLDVLERALLRDELVDRLGFTATLADAIVSKPKASETKQQGSAMLFTELEPWPDHVSGTQLLEELVCTLTRYVVLPSDGATAVALWILHSHALDAAQITPRLAIVSPEKRCGKSTLLKLLAALVRRPLPVTNITAGVLFRTIENHCPTLLVDEVDTFLRDRDDVRGVLNAGHDRQTAKVPRCVGDDHEPRVFGVWAPVAFAGIGKQHDTLMDRSIVIAMKRRSVAERVAAFRRRQREALGDLRRKCIRWARDVLEQLQQVEPAPPPGLDDRAADNWEPLFAIAQVAGGIWPEQARSSALALSGVERAEEADTHGEQLLTDIRVIFDEGEGGSIPAKDLLDALLALDERPWLEANRGRPLSAAQLGKRLGRFGIHSHTARIGGTTARSYFRADFEDAFSRYLVPLSATSGTRAGSADNSIDSEPSHLWLVTDAANPQSPSDFDDVTDVTDAEPADQSYLTIERVAIEEFGS